MCIFVRYFDIYVHTFFDNVSKENTNELGQSHPSSYLVSLADNFYLYILDVYSCALFLCALNCAWFIHIYIYIYFFFAT